MSEPWTDPHPPLGTVGGHPDYPIVRVWKICKRWHPDKRNHRGEKLGCGKHYVGWVFQRTAPTRGTAQKYTDEINGDVFVWGLCDRCIDRLESQRRYKSEAEREREALEAVELDTTPQRMEGYV